MSFKVQQVVMLPTNQKAAVGMLALYHNLYSNTEWFLDMVHKIEMQDYLKVWTKAGILAEGPQAKVTAKYHHLYVTSETKIEPGDWMLDNHFNYPTQCTNQYSSYLKNHCKKIIATTDKTLHTGFAKTLCPKCNSKMTVHPPDHIKCTECEQIGWNLTTGVYHEITFLTPLDEAFVLDFRDYYNNNNLISEAAIFDNNTIKVKPSKTISVKESFLEAHKTYQSECLNSDGDYSMSFIEWIEKNL